MKRKKWSELEEESLIAKYSELLNCGALVKLKTREKKFKPIADHVNSVHHLQDPLSYPFRWSWRDVSIKVQNMRHQYLGVKQKIRVSDGEFNWKDGENHWQNFMKYKEVFGDLPLDIKGKRLFEDAAVSFDGSDDLEFGIGVDSDELEEEEEEEDDDDEDEDRRQREQDVAHDGDARDDGSREVSGEVEVAGDDGKRVNFGEIGIPDTKKLKRGSGLNRQIVMAGLRVLDLKDVVTRREEKRRAREFRRERNELNRDESTKNTEFTKAQLLYEKEQQLEMRELEMEERELIWARRELKNRLRLEREIEEERRKRMKMAEKTESEEMEWRERIVEMQIEHEKQMMQMQAEAFQNQMQILGVIARLLCQYFGSANDGLGALPPQVLQNLQHPGELDENGKPDVNSPSEFL